MLLQKLFCAIRLRLGIGCFFFLVERGKSCITESVAELFKFIFLSSKILDYINRDGDATLEVAEN